MGVTGFWNIVEHTGIENSNFEGKTLAVDLSSWICDNSQAANIKKPYIRNIFFRASSLLQNGAHLIFVSEGKAPAIKEATLHQRNEMRHGTSDKSTSSTLQRNHLKSISNECQRLLSCLGIPFIVSKGEAEATCAYLNYKKVVDGCITDDSDAFLYGALTVYKDFKLENKCPVATQFNIEKIKEEKSLDRRRLVALALLLGCDYEPSGVPGVGKECAMKLLKQIPNHVDVIERYKKWVSDDTELFPSIDFDLAKRKISHCPTCQHPGTDKKHAKSGCSTCSLDKGCIPNNSECNCEWHKNLRLKNIHGLEIGIRDKARTVLNFPNKDLIDEFLNFEDQLPLEKIEWKYPKCKEFIDFMNYTLNWTPEESWERLHPLIARWQLLALVKTPSIKPPIKALRILKKRQLRGLKCFEVEWEIDDDISSHKFVTVEPRHLVDVCYPDLVTLFEPPAPIKEKKTKIRNTRKREPTNNTKVGKSASSNSKPTGSQLTLEQMFQKLSVRVESEVENTALSPIPSKQNIVNPDIGPKYDQNNPEVKNDILNISEDTPLSPMPPKQNIVNIDPKYDQNTPEVKNDIFNISKNTPFSPIPFKQNIANPDIDPKYDQNTPKGKNDILNISDIKADFSMSNFILAENMSFDVSGLQASSSCNLKEENISLNQSLIDIKENNISINDNDLSKDLFPSPSVTFTSAISKSIESKTPENKPKFEINLDFSFDSPLPLRERIKAKIEEIKKK